MMRAGVHGREMPVGYRYRRPAFRTIVMFPASADEQEVDEVVARTAAAFKARRSFRGMSTNDGPLMGPSAKRGEFGRVFEADFDELDDVLEALGADDLREVKAATEALGPTPLLLALRDLVATRDRCPSRRGPAVPVDRHAVHGLIQERPARRPVEVARHAEGPRVASACRDTSMTRAGGRLPVEVARHAEGPRVASACRETWAMSASGQRVR